MSTPGMPNEAAVEVRASPSMLVLLRLRLCMMSEGCKHLQNESGEQSWEECTSSDDDQDVSWIVWFCTRKGNEFLTEVSNLK